MSNRPVLLQGRATAAAPRSTQTSSPSALASSPRPSAAIDWEATQLAQELHEAASRPVWRRLTGRSTSRSTEDFRLAREVMAIERRTQTVVPRVRLARNICWPAIRREFEVELGQSFAVRVQHPTLRDWRSLVAGVRQSGYKHSIERLGGFRNPFVSSLHHRLTIELNEQVQLTCQTNRHDCIELTFDPQRIASEADFRLLSQFVEQLNQILGRDAEITDGEQALFRASVDSEGLLVWCPKGA